ncbi:NDE1, mitochondrial external NADH dehydrogenase [Mycena floridula]|nr:NDE1, mitochondrial external NADH dehydrogenase [Mycena floridula]
MISRSSKVKISSCRLFSSSASRGKERLVILGSGWGGYNLLQGVDKRRWDVTILAPRGHFNFTPLLAGCAVGTLEFSCSVEPVRRYAPQVTTYQAWCDKIDFTHKTLQCMPATAPISMQPETMKQTASSPFTLKYDKLVISVGAYSQTFDIPGVKEHAHFLKDVKDARAIHSRIVECLEQANQPTISDDDRRKLLNFCIVGGGPTGVEFAAELHDLLYTEITRYYPALARLAKINLYDVAPQILGSFDKSLVQYAEKTFRREGISIWTSHHVTRVESGRMFVKEQGEVPFGLLVWSTGLSANPLIDSITELKKDAKSIALITDDHLNAIRQDGSKDPDVWVIGDCGQIEEVILPATAQVASQKGKYLVKKLNKFVKDQPSPKPFNFRNFGQLSYIGDWKAIYDRPGTDGSSSTKDSGRLAWLIWRGAYFTMTLSIKNRIRVPFYWFLNWIFGRDLTRF